MSWDQDSSLMNSKPVDNTWTIMCFVISTTKWKPEFLGVLFYSDAKRWVVAARLHAASPAFAASHREASTSWRIYCAPALSAMALRGVYNCSSADPDSAYQTNSRKWKNKILEYQENRLKKDENTSYQSILWSAGNCKHHVYADSHIFKLK